MKFKLLLILSYALLFIGCVKDDSLAIPIQMQNITISAGMGIDTKASISQTGTFTWHENDAISVLATDGLYYTLNLTSGAGTKNAEFTGSIPEGIDLTTIATYPAIVENGKHSSIYDETTKKLKFTLSEEYNYAEGYATVPMVATFATGSQTLSFKHIGALIRIPFSGMHADSKIYVTATNRKISGEFSIPTDSIGSASGVISSSETTTGNKITINYTFEDSDNTTDINIPIPVGTYEDFKVVVKNSQDTEVFSNSWNLSSVEFKRANILVFPEQYIKPTVTYIPRFQGDNSYVVSTTKEYSFVELDFEVSPKNIIPELVSNYTTAFKMQAVMNTTESKDIIELPITSLTADQNGIISVKAACSSLNDSFFSGETDACLSLTMTTSNDEVSSSEIPTKVAKRTQHPSAKSPKVVAHRGYWRATGSTQNSITALRKANELGVWGCELDLWMTTDGVLVLNHDGVINGVSIQNSPFSSIKDFTLDNGETLPTFEDYLTVFKNECSDLILIIELKPHYSNDVTIEAVRQILKIVEEFGLADKVEYISFSSVAGDAIVRYNPKARFSYLESDLTPCQCAERGYAGVDYHYQTYRDNWKLIPEAHELGMEVNCWTLNYESIVEKIFTQQHVDIITTDYPESIEQWLLQ